MSISLSRLCKLLLSYLFVCASSVFAISIDSFSNDSGEQFAEAKPPGVSISSLASSFAMGGVRGFKAQANLGSPYLHVLLATSTGLLSHSQDVQVTGFTEIIWNGGVGFDGLGGIDMTQDGGDRFLVEVISYDLPGGPNGNPLELKLTVFDASDFTGNESSSASIAINSQISSSTIFEFPYANFVQSGLAGPASFLNVGAVVLQINGVDTPSADLIINSIGTNGACNLVPDLNGKVIDACGVCGGNNSTCADCNGVPFGSAVVDRCGVCQGDGFSCLDCTFENEKDLQTTLDGGAKAQEKIAKRIGADILRLSNNAAHKLYVEKSLKLTHELQIKNWTLSWTELPTFSVQCTNLLFCTSVSNVPILDTYRTRSEQLRVLTVEMAKKLKKLRPGQMAFERRVKNYIAIANRQHKKNIDNTYLFPTFQSTCV